MMKRMLLLLTLLALSAGPALARDGKPEPRESKTSLSTPSTQQDFSGDGTQWWVIEQIVQQIKEFVSSHISNNQP